MPIYEYRCGDCERGFEVLVRSPRERIECPTCRGANLTREMSVFASGSPREAGGESAAAAARAISRNGGGCCGGSCGCR